MHVYIDLEYTNVDVCIQLKYINLIRHIKYCIDEQNEYNLHVCRVYCSNSAIKSVFVYIICLCTTVINNFKNS